MNRHANALDDLPSLQQGRLMTLEVLIVLLLRDSTGIEALLAQADAMLVRIEAGAVEGTTTVEREVIRRMMNGARYSLGNLAGQVRRGTKH